MGFKSCCEVVSTKRCHLAIAAVGCASPYPHLEQESSGRSGAAPRADGVGGEREPAVNCPAFKRETKQDRGDWCLSDHASASLARLVSYPSYHTAALMEGCVWKMAKLGGAGGDDANAMPLLQQDALFFLKILLLT